MLATVDALLPLSLLEAVRNVDTPSDQETEYVDELRNKRLGLSETVYAQIKRHTEAVRRGQRTGQDETIALARLIGRRPDAEAVFRAAGRRLALQSYMTISPLTRKLMRLLPSAMARPGGASTKGNCSMSSSLSDFIRRITEANDERNTSGSVNAARLLKSSSS